MGTWSNIARNATKPGHIRVMAKKLLRRSEGDTRAEATAWASEQAIKIEAYCQSLDAAGWHQATESAAALDADARRRLADCGHELGGGGAYPLLYFLVRQRKPSVVVETGVAAGWTSRAILQAIYDNGAGKLYSSDFPYFRLASPEQYVGLVVPDHLRSHWHLDIRGDEVALPAIVSHVDHIDLFHFDSDKSAAGRAFAMKTVEPFLTDNSIVLMDDIQDNLFFRDWCRLSDRQPLVFEFEGKYIGAVGLP